MIKIYYQKIYLKKKDILKRKNIWSEKMAFDRESESNYV